MSVTAVGLGGRTDQPLLVLGPSLGTSAATLWSAAAEHLMQDFHVVAWDLPGHGTNRSRPDSRLTMEKLARDVVEMVDSVHPETRGRSFHYAGDSIGGAVGLRLLLDAPDRVLSASLFCTGARIGTVESWQERAAAVRSAGTPSLVSASVQRWFAPGFLERDPATGSALLHALSDADDAAYAALCEALAGFDVRDRLGEIRTPVLAGAGELDVATPPDVVEEIAQGVHDARFVVLPRVAHLAPVEAPVEVARLIRGLALGPVDGAGKTLGDLGAQGMEVRRAVLGDEHVDRATEAATAFTRDFQELITRYAWGEIWTRPGLDRRSRSLITLTALVARGHHEELAMHVKAARRNGVTVDEIKELLLQTAIYCGVPDANAAFRIAQKALSDLDEA